MHWGESEVELKVVGNEKNGKEVGTRNERGGGRIIGRRKRKG